MNRYKIICVGKVKEYYYRNEIDKLCNRIRQYGGVIDIIEISDMKIPDNLGEERKESFLQKECAPMRSKIGNNDYVIALCIEGIELTTDRHKTYTDKACDLGKDSIVYVIGGSLGLPEWIKSRADLKMSFSKMTFPHQLMRVVLLEEIINVISR